MELFSTEESLPKLTVDPNGYIHLNGKPTPSDILQLNIETIGNYFKINEEQEESLQPTDLCYTIDTSELQNEYCIKPVVNDLSTTEEVNPTGLIIKDEFTYQLADDNDGRYIIFTDENESNILNPQIVLKSDYDANYYAEIIDNYGDVAAETLQQIKVESAVIDQEFAYDGSAKSDLELTEEPFNVICKCCSQLFTSEALFNRHSRSVSTLDKPYQCQICEKHFSQQSNLWKHIRTHTGERPFVCSECGKAFTQRANMMKHKIIHTGEKPYVCGVCGHAFTQEANMNKHIRLHTGVKPYVCEFCNKRFSQRSNLVKHRYLHQGIRPFSCDICYQSFTQQSNLKKHELTHTNVRNYFCDFCKKGYIQKISVQKHMEKCQLRYNTQKTIFQ